MTANNKKDQNDAQTLRKEAACQGLELHQFRGPAGAWMLARFDSCECPFTLLPDLDAVAACLRREPWALRRFTPALDRFVASRRGAA